MSSEIPLPPLKTLATESATVGLSVSVLNPVKSLLAASEIAGVSESERTPLKTLATASEIAGLSDVALNPLKTLLARSEGATTSERNARLVLVWPTMSDISEEMFSEIPLPPLKTLPTTSEGTTLTCGNFPAPLLTESVIAEARFSCTDLPEPLLTIAANAEASLSDVLRNPWNISVTLSDIADTEFSEIARPPVKTLPMTSEGTTFTCANFPAPLLSETAIETTSDKDLVAPLVTTPEIVDRSSDVVLNPVKTLPTTSEGTTLRSGNFPAPLLMLPPDQK